MDTKNLYELSIGLMATCGKLAYTKQIKACIETWIDVAAKYNIHTCLFCDREVDNEIEDMVKNNNHIHIYHFDLDSDYSSAFYKHLWGYKILHETFPSKYYLMGGTDNYFNIEKILEVLPKYTYSEKFVIGGLMDMRTEIFAINFPDGGCGIIKTYGATVEMYQHIDWLIKIWENMIKVYFLTYLNAACDVAIGYLCHYLGIPLISDPLFIKNDWLIYPYGYYWNPCFFPEILPLGKLYEDNNFCSYHYMTHIEIYLCHRYKNKNRNSLLWLSRYGKSLLKLNIPVTYILNEITEKYDNYHISYSSNNAFSCTLIYDIIHTSLYKHHINNEYTSNIDVEHNKNNYLLKIITNAIHELNAEFIKINSVTSPDCIYIENSTIKEVKDIVNALNTSNLKSLLLISYNNNDFKYPDILTINNKTYSGKKYNEVYEYTNTQK